MSILVLVRHGQTTGFLTDGYTHLTDVGQAQAAALRPWFAAHHPRVDAVFTGTLTRHHETAAGASLADWPAPQVLDGLDEHDGIGVLTQAMQDGALDASEVAQVVAGGAPRMRVFQRVMQRWAAEGTKSPSGQTWPAFRSAVAGALDHLCTGRGRTVVAFTSGGVVGAAVAQLLGVDDPRTALDLAHTVDNASVTLVRFSGARRTLWRFNGVGHLEEVAPVTGV